MLFRSVAPVFSAPVFHEFVVRFRRDALLKLQDRGIVPGVPLAPDYPELEGGLLMNVTEMNTNEDIQCLTELL